MFDSKAFYIEMVDKKGSEATEATDLKEAAIGLSKLVVITGSALIVVNGLMKILVNLTDPK